MLMNVKQTMEDAHIDVLTAMAHSIAHAEKDLVWLIFLTVMVCI